MKSPDEITPTSTITDLDELRKRLDAAEKLRRQVAELQADRAAAVAAAGDPFDKKLAPKLKTLAEAERDILDYAEACMNEVFPGETRKFTSALSGLTCRACPPSVVCDEDDEDAAIARLFEQDLTSYVKTKYSLEKARIKSVLSAQDDDWAALAACGLSLSEDEWKVDFLKKQ